MKPLDKLQQIKLWKYSFWLIVFLVVCWMVFFYLYFFRQDDVNLVKRVEHQIEEFFVDESHDMIDSTITVEKLNELIDQTNHLESYRSRDLREKVRITTLKFQDWMLLNQMLTEQASQYSLDDQLLENIETHLTKEEFDKLYSSRKYHADDTYSQLMDQLFNHVANIIDGHIQYKQLISDLSTDIEDIEQLKIVLAQMKEIEELQVLAQKHVNSQQTINELETKLFKIVNQIETNHEQEPLDDTLIDQLFNSKNFASKLSGHELDPRLLVSLTFDDGPNEEYTTQVLDILNQYEIQGTFFVMGAYVDDYPEIAKRIVDEGHIIANHTYSHPDLSKSTQEEVLQQIEWAQDSIRDVTGVEAHLFRMPFGSGGKRVVDLASNEGLTSIIWNVDTLDWESHDVNSIVERTWLLLEKRSIILMHDTHQATPDALKIIIPELIKKGYEFVDPLQVGYDYRFFAHES